MFIDQTGNTETCAPAERNVFGDGTHHSVTFRSGARRSLVEVACSINNTSLRDEGK
jgi:hypothetical protein